MEEFFEALTGGAVWGAGFALAAGVLGGLGKGMRPLAKNVIKGSIAVSDWVRSATEETRETFADIYEEARSERAQASADHRQVTTTRRKTPAQTETGAVE
jgi:hypothetical protein